MWAQVVSRKEPYTTESCSAHHLNSALDRLVHNFLASTLQGRISCLRHVSVEDLWMMETIESQFGVNIAEYMIMRIRQVVMREETTLPYGNISSTLVKKKGIWSNRYLANWTSHKPRNLSFRWLVKGDMT
ncbi:Uncharacterized protein TCM_022331 [Theobroma cacao]|uniref:Uncharacterized protein n=1 Tax=Theobroma cacao TaxID=3641 RepID=A0A061ESI2_THECC|nr:Uncharacterized protein TCM_022331 [Theobroma cacao]